ncbi:MAG: hypothetical protein ACLFUU_03295 [Desulfobacteraceae bacterium]
MGAQPRTPVNANHPGGAGGWAVGGQHPLPAALGAEAARGRGNGMPAKARVASPLARAAGAELKINQLSLARRDPQT